MRRPRFERYRAPLHAAALLALVCFPGALSSPAAKKKDKPIPTQTLELPQDLPNSVVGETRRLGFYVTPLFSKGLLSQQIRDALKSVSRQAGSAPILHIRAFTAGTGDLRRVRDLVSDYFTERRQPLPSLTLVQSGGLPREAAQVVLEAIASEKKDVNPFGLAFLFAPAATSDNPLDAVAPLAARSLEALRQSLQKADLDPKGVLRVTCFLTSLDNLAATRLAVANAYPHAAANYVQTRRAPSQASAACEAVARLGADPGAPLRFLDSGGPSPVALVAAPRIVLTGSQISFGYQERDARLAFDRLAKELEETGCSPRDVAVAHFYALAPSIAAQVDQLRTGFFAPTRPAGSVFLIEGLPSLDAGFAVDAVAVKPDSPPQEKR